MMRVVMRFERRQRFEWDAGRERRFVLVSQEDDRVTVRPGVVTADGDVIDAEATTIERYGDRAVADDAFELVGRDALAEGAVAVAFPPQHFRRHDAHEARCIGSPDAPAPWAAYAAWLARHGDLRATLAAHVRADDAAAQAQLLAAHALDLLGTEHARFHLDYRHGFIVGAEIAIFLGSTSDRLDEAAALFLAAPAGRFVERLRFGLAAARHGNDWAPTLHAIARSGRARAIRSLALDAYDYRDSKFHLTSFGDLGDAWAALPALESLRIRAGGHGRLGALHLPHLQAFTLEHANLRTQQVDDIARARWPNLRSLDLAIGRRAHESEATLARLRPILHGEGMPVLEHLALRDCEFADELVDDLARSPLLPRLRSLAVTGSRLASAGARSLLASAAAFRHLDAFDLGCNYLTRDEATRIRRALPRATTADQQPRDGDDAPQFERVPMFSAEPT